VRGRGRNTETGVERDEYKEAGRERVRKRGGQGRERACSSVGGRERERLILLRWRERK